MKDLSLFIYLKTLSFEERTSIFESGSYSIPDENFNSKVLDYINKWKEYSSQNHNEKFLRRLEWGNFDFEKLNLIISLKPNDITKPSWLLLFEEFNDKHIIGSLHFDLPKEINLPNIFLNYFHSLLTFAQKKIKKNDNISISALKGVQDYLITRLLQLHHKTINSKEFLDEFSTFESQKFWQKYPVITRLTFQILEFHIDFFNNFFNNLESDYTQIQNTFFNSNNVGNLIKILASLSDPHDMGKSVLALEFENGLKLIYKTKDLSLEVAFQNLLKFINKQDTLPQFKLLKIVNSKKHGWVEFVEKKDCNSIEEISLFYKNAGVLTGLLHFFKTVDCHFENFIANGPNFVFIDIETIFHHDVKLNLDFSENTDSGDEVSDILLNSILRTGILPRWNFRANEKLAIDISAFGYYNFDSDNLPAHLPTFNGETVTIERHINEFINGFRDLYYFILHNKETLIHSNEFFELANCEVRFIFRPTRVYWSVLRNSLSPEFLKDGVLRSFYIDILSRAYLLSDYKPANWGILSNELKSIEQLDIPYFKTITSSDAINLKNGIIVANYFKKSSYHAVIDSIKSATLKDLEFQIELIKGTIFSRRTVHKNIYVSSKVLNVGQTLNNTDYVGEAERIAKEIEDRAILGNDGSAKWISFEYSFNSERFQLSALRDDLYNGNGGIAVFYSALYKVTKNIKYKNLAFSALEFNNQLLNNINYESKKRFLKRGIGGAIGISSNIYSLVKCSQLLNDNSLLEKALSIGYFFDDELIQTDKQFDIINGSAGAILGLSSLYNVTNDSKILPILKKTGNYLIKNSINLNSRYVCWNVLEKKHTGFSHGVSGIAYALFKLFEVTQIEEYKSIAEKAVQYENSLFNENNKNWVDLRTSDIEENILNFGNSWCHGAPGIGMARLGIYNITKEERYLKDVNIAMDYCINHTLDDYDCLCCGNFGRIELLSLIQKYLSFDLEETISNKFDFLINDRKHKGYRYPFIPSNMFLPSLFQGTSGIAYQILKKVDKTLPSVLIWE